MRRRTAPPPLEPWEAATATAKGRTFTEVGPTEIGARRTCFSLHSISARRLKGTTRQPQPRRSPAFCNCARPCAAPHAGLPSSLGGLAAQGKKENFRRRQTEPGISSSSNLGRARCPSIKRTACHFAVPLFYFRRQSERTRLHARAMPGPEFMNGYLFQWNVGTH